MGGGVRWGSRSTVWCSWLRRINELTGAISSLRSRCHIGLQPVEDESRGGSLRVSGVRIDHKEGIGAIIARDGLES
jgi:hypothetical protein